MFTDLFRTHGIYFTATKIKHA